MMREKEGGEQNYTWLIESIYSLSLSLPRTLLLLFSVYFSFVIFLSLSENFPLFPFPEHFVIDVVIFSLQNLVTYYHHQNRSSLDLLLLSSLSTLITLFLSLSLFLHLPLFLIVRSRLRHFLPLLPSQPFSRNGQSSVTLSGLIWF